MQTTPHYNVTVVGDDGLIGSVVHCSNGKWEAFSASGMRLASYDSPGEAFALVVRRYEDEKKVEKRA